MTGERSRRPPRRRLVAIAGAALAALALTACGTTSDGPAAHRTRSGGSISAEVGPDHPASVDYVAATSGPHTKSCRASRSKGVACATTTDYRFAPGSVRTLRLIEAKAVPAPSGTGWSVDLTTTPDDAPRLASMTRTLAGTDRSLLLLAPGTATVITAAQVGSPIADGRIQISGNFSESRAKHLAALLRHRGS